MACLKPFVYPGLRHVKCLFNYYRSFTRFPIWLSSECTVLRMNHFLNLARNQKLSLWLIRSEIPWSAILFLVTANVSVGIIVSYFQLKYLTSRGNNRIVLADNRQTVGEWVIHIPVSSNRIAVFVFYGFYSLTDAMYICQTFRVGTADLWIFGIPKLCLICQFPVPMPLLCYCLPLINWFIL